MMTSEYPGEMSTNQEKIMQDLGKENVEMKFKIDSFKREHQTRITELRKKLGLDINLEAVLKTKGN